MGDGQIVRDDLFVETVDEALCRLATCQRNGQIFNIGSSVAPSF